MAEKKNLTVFASLDAEEEGLFSGRYKSSGVSTENIPLIRELRPLFSEYGIPLTLFCSYPVFKDRRALETILWAREECGAEIGAHLHHWATPPFEDARNENVEPERTHKLPPPLLAEKLRILLESGFEATGERLTSFRMGRWDLKSSLFTLLAENGILTDCSVAPLRIRPDGPDHFLAPADPYWVSLPGGKKILEIPVTQIPLFKRLPGLWRKLCSAPEMIDRYHFFGALSCNPLWHSSMVMKLAARALAARGGKVLSFFWHSSELMPGGSQKSRTRNDAREMLRKSLKFCGWLKDNFNIMGATAREIRESGPEFPGSFISGDTDWR
ncbi:MAG: hypothetical protein K2H64_00320 [Desulfovibrio sp.]|nr:hypothetical protein [Desulfovibrio sp.]